jgi:NAD(P)-dependent dehydrogenase (short-subunit alcohol dehydrogenase family)
MDRSVFITGAGMGLGLSFTKKFLSEGWTVFAGALEPSPALEALRQDHERGLVVTGLDVRSDDSVAAARDAVSGRTESLDMLINNAGINPGKDTPLEELDFRLVSEAIDVNALGPLRVAKAFLPLLESGGFKRIVEVSSEAGSITDCTRTAWFGYCMSKASLNMQGRILQNYLGPRGFTVLMVHPGWMRTNMAGPEATYDPDESAGMLYPRITCPADGIGARYFQYDGKPLNW